ncbi:hypothetical protein QTH90_21055 [Variovorax sp. J2P1-59]|uniref:hypothetical protein n=1 Tax=Variovorax flavidus TaxID=3053501 RepID=UPI0025765A93|nr:hypothetical protein [Variovorax sp. J2P1-59]MDM0076911.1 hypothetical protein [Variovorax sp. J2P1-59]
MSDGRSAQAMTAPGAEGRRLLAGLILDLLRVRAQVEVGSWTTCDVCADVGEVMSIDCRDVKEVLEQLRALGLIQDLSPAEQAGGVSTNTWVTAPAYAATLGRGGDDGGGGLTPNDDGPASSPRRFPEVLAHPVLFALSPEDFESTLVHMLPE